MAALGRRMEISTMSINCLASPIICVEEMSNKKINQSGGRDELLDEIKIVRPYFQIGSISDLCSKISAEEQNSPFYKKLLVEENSCGDSSVQTFPGRRCEQPAIEKTLCYDVQKTVKEKPNRTHKLTGRPKLIELYQYSGVDESGLPNGVVAMEILERIARSLPALRGQSKYKPYFEKIFYSPVSQSILKDVFWWMFLDGWYPERSTQERLFERVACSYVQLIILAEHPYYAEPFLKSYPRLLSQATYSAFCETFTDSYTSFNNDFKEKLVNVVYQWLTGLKPAARSWLKWNLDDLEPVEIKNRRDLLKTSSVTSPRKSTSGDDDPDLQFMTTGEELNLDSKSSGKESRKSTGTSRKSTGTSRTSVTTSGKKFLKESHPSCRGPDFVPTAFRLNGQSPAVSHFLQAKNLEVKAGTEMVVRRTELENLPPIDFPTYSDLISATCKSLRANRKAYTEFYSRCVKENQELALLRRQAFKKRQEKEALLLSKPPEVKRLSEAIMLEFRKDKDSASQAAKQAIEQAIEAVK